MGLGDYPNFVGPSERHMSNVPTNLDCSLDECPIVIESNESGDIGIVFCEECWSPQYETPSGRSCENGHGGASSRHESDLPMSVEADLDQAKHNGLDVRALAYEHNARLRINKERTVEGQQSNEQQNTDQKSASVPEHNSRHKVRALSHAIGAAGTKTEQIGVMCEVTEGPCKGYVCTWYGSFTQDAYEYTMRGMEALGFNGDAPECKSMYSQEGLATFEHDKDRDGKPRVRIAWINGMDVVMKERYTGAQLANFSQRLNAAYRSKHGGNMQGAGSLPPMQQQQAQPQQPPPQQSWGGGGGWNGRGGNNSMPPRNDVPPPSEPPPWERGR